jgi:hypothetical protein
MNLCSLPWKGRQLSKQTPSSFLDQACWLKPQVLINYSAAPAAAAAADAAAAATAAAAAPIAAAAAAAVGVQLRPDLPVHNLQGGLQQAVAAGSSSSSSSSSSSAAAGDVAGWLRGVSSVALSYSPEGRTRAGEVGMVEQGGVLSISV